MLIAVLLIIEKVTDENTWKTIFKDKSEKENNTEQT